MPLGPKSVIESIADVMETQWTEISGSFEIHLIGWSLLVNILIRVGTELLGHCRLDLVAIELVYEELSSKLVGHFIIILTINIQIFNS